MEIVRKCWDNFTANDERILYGAYVHRVTYCYDKMSKTFNAG